jgi:hypothetical protein
MAITRMAIGTPREASQPDAIKAAFAEFFSMLIFVFAGEGSGMAFSKISISNTCLSRNRFKIFGNNFLLFFLFVYLLKVD